MLNRDSPHVKKSVECARKLRKSMTPAERILWQHLRAGQLLNLRFRRQELIGPYMVDFYCLAARLVIELDGISHVDRLVEDIARQEYIESRGYKVVRFTNRDIYENIAGVLEMTVDQCQRHATSEMRREGL